MGGGKWGKGGGKGGKGGKGGGKKKKSKSRKSLNFRSVPTTDDASVHAAVDAAGPAAAAPRSGKDLWSLDSVKKLVPPPKKPSLMYRLYKSAKRAAGFKSTKKGLALDEEEEEEDDDPGVKPSSSATAPTTTATATATAATTTTAGSPLANDARLVNPFASLGKLDPSSPSRPVSGSPPRPPGSLPSGESGGGGAPRARIAHPAEANAAERGETRKTFSVYSAYKGLRRRVRGDFSDFGKMTKDASRGGSPSLPRVRRERNVDDERRRRLRRARCRRAEGPSSPGYARPVQPRPAPVSRDVRVGTRGVPGILSSGSEPASSESTASRAYREALRVMLPPDARARAAAGNRRRGRRGPSRPGRRRREVIPAYPRDSRGEVSTRRRPRDTFRARRRGRTTPKRRPGTCPGPTRPRPRARPLPKRPRPRLANPRETPGHPPRSRAPRDRSRGGGGARGGHPRGRFRAATRALIGDMRRRSDAVAGVARGALEVFDTLLALEPAAASLGRVQRRVDPAFWARVPPPPPQPPRASLRVAASDPRCVSRPRLDARKSVRFRAVQAAAKRGTSDSRLGEDGRTENVSAENVSANVEDSLPDRPAPRASGFTRGSPRVVVDDTRGARVTHVVLAVDVFVFFSGRFAGASNVGLRPRRIRRRGPPRAEPRDDGGGARARGGDGQTHQSRGTITIRDAVRFRIGRRRRRRRRVLVLGRAIRVSSVSSFASPRERRERPRESPRGASRDAGAACRGESVHGGARVVGRVDRVGQVGRVRILRRRANRRGSRRGAERVRLRGGARGRRCRERDEGGVEGARARGGRR